MKGYGNYRFARQVERRPGTLLSYRGSRAIVRFHNGQAQSMSAKPLRTIGIAPKERFVMVITWQGKEIADAHVERPPPARTRMIHRHVPKIMRRDGRKVVTRK